MKKLLAYHDDPALKEKFLARVRAHAEADEIVKGKYWDNGKGCAVGCTIHSGDHLAYETELGIPRQLAHLEDIIFENLPDKEAVKWPAAFLEAIEPGTNLALVESRFILWMLTDPEKGVIRFAKRDGEVAIRGVAKLWKLRIDGKEPSAVTWRAAWSAAWSAAGSATFKAQAAKLLQLIREAR